MKSFIRIAAVMLILAQLFAISASAAFTASDLEQMNTALDEANTQPSGAQEGSAAAENAEREAQEREAEEAAAAAEAAREAARASTKIDYEIAPVTQFGTAEDVMIGGLRITPVPASRSLPCTSSIIKSRLTQSERKAPMPRFISQRICILSWKGKMS